MRQRQEQIRLVGRRIEQDDVVLPLVERRNGIGCGAHQVLQLFRHLSERVSVFRYLRQDGLRNRAQVGQVLLHVPARQRRAGVLHALFRQAQGLIGDQQIEKLLLEQDHGVFRRNVARRLGLQLQRIVGQRVLPERIHALRFAAGGTQSFKPVAQQGERLQELAGEQLAGLRGIVGALLVGQFLDLPE